MASVTCLLDPHLTLPPCSFPLGPCSSCTTLPGCSKCMPILGLLPWLCPLLETFLQVRILVAHSLPSSRLCSHVTFSVKPNLSTLLKLAMHPFYPQCSDQFIVFCIFYSTYAPLSQKFLNLGHGALSLSEIVSQHFCPKEISNNSLY